MRHLDSRLDRLERASCLDDRLAATATAADAFRRDILGLADRIEAAGETRHDPRLSPRENMARALARGDFETARGIVDAATRGRTDEGAR